MLNAPIDFPHVGSIAFLDERDAAGADVVERVRILRDNGDGTRLISFQSARYSHEAAGGNRSVPFAALRATEQARPVATPAKRARRRAR